MCSSPLIFLLIYVVGIMVSLWILPRGYAKWVGLDCYDPPHENWYDDYDSNASAWFAFSLAWPIFYTFTLIGMSYSTFINFYKSKIK